MLFVNHALTYHFWFCMWSGNKMDEVFGNCSSETVMEADLSRVLDHINQDIADLQYLESQLQASSPMDQDDFQYKPDTSFANPHSYNKCSLSTNNVAHIVNKPLVKSVTLPQTVDNQIVVNEPAFAKPTVIPRSSVAHVPVIKSIGKMHNHGPKPQPRHVIDTFSKGGSLRHTQSAVAEKRRQEQSIRPRAQSTGSNSQINYQHVHYCMEYYQHNYHIEQLSHAQKEHGYVNINPNFLHSQPTDHQRENQPLSEYDGISSSIQGPPHSAPPVIQANHAYSHLSNCPLPVQTGSKPQYVNINPSGSTTFSPAKKSLRNSHTNGSNSAPSTPRGGGSSSDGRLPPHFHHSYIELWSGVKEERDSLSDSECEELKRSFQEPQTPNGPPPGYVEMSSPYIKSPQITSSFNGSVLDDLATKLASYAGHLPRNIFCPFCPRYFGYEKSLGSHIHKIHREELNTMVDSCPGEVKIQFCPLCQARFFSVSVLPKHLIDFHRASVIEILEKNNCIMSDVSGIQCPFCVKKVPHGKTGEQVLLYHMQQLHLTDFENMIQSKFQPYSTGEKSDSLKSISSNEASEPIAFQPGVTSTPGLSGKLNTLSLIHVNRNRNMEALNLDATWSSHCGLPKSPIPLSSAYSQKSLVENLREKEHSEKGHEKHPSPANKGILRTKSELNRKPSVKRELRFSVPPVTSKEIFIPESPEQSTPDHNTEHQQQNDENQRQQMRNQTDGYGHGVQRVIPIRIDSLSAADFIDLNEKSGCQRKRRRLGLGLQSRKAFKKKDKENIGDRELGHIVSGASKFVENAKKIITEGSYHGKEIVSTQHTRTFRRPKPVAVPRVPEALPSANQDGEAIQNFSEQKLPERDRGTSEVSPFTQVKLYSPLRMFRCNSCRIKFCDNESLGSHIGSRHRGLLYILRPLYGCGICSARFFENKYLVKHCLQHHTSLLEIRSPSKHKISIYRFSHE
ncbi:hypothetical protein SK128_000133 [Halocaridina rubra]|uniref:C2H2-type domain-containing protein n=1 Tax=Halocaridina rubra TaxID=373956 RepID=A0AAN9A5N3_HALRR